MHAANVNKTEMHTPVVAQSIGETNKKINGVGNYSARGWGTNADPAHEWTSEGSQSPRDTGRGLG